MVFQLLADKLRSMYFKAEVWILYLSLLGPPNNLSFAEHSSARFLAEPASSPTPQETEVASVGKGGAGPCEQPVWQSRASRKQAGRGKPSEERCACVSTAVLRDQAPSRQLRFAGLVKGKKRYSQEVGQG